MRKKVSAYILNSNFTAKTNTMDYGQRPQRTPFPVGDLNITCAECGVKIEELPFQPTKKEDGTFGRIYCRECNSKRRQSFGRRPGYGGGGGGFRRDRY